MAELRHIKREKESLPLDVCHSKTSLLKLLNREHVYNLVEVDTSIRMLILKREKIKLRHTPQQFLSSDVYFLRSFLALSYRLIPFEEKTKTTTMRTTAYKQQCKCMEVIKNELYLSVNVLSWKVPIDKLGNLFFVSNKQGHPTGNFEKKA